MSDNNQYTQIKKVFYDAFDDSTVLPFAVDFAGTVAGLVTNLYRLHDGIHIGIYGNMFDVSEKEITDIFSSAVKEFIITKTNDESLANYAKENITSLVKILFIDKENLTIII